MEQRFTYIEKRQKKISLSSMCQSSMAREFLLVADSGQFAYVHPSHVAVEGTLSPPCEEVYDGGGGQVPYDTHI